MHLYWLTLHARECISDKHKAVGHLKWAVFFISNGGMYMNETNSPRVSLYGKPVYTEDTFDYSAASPGDYVDQAVVDNAMNCMPPVCISSACSQMGEPYAHREDPNTGKWRPVFATFKRVTASPNAVWQFCGFCFQGETTELERTLSTVPWSYNSSSPSTTTKEVQR